MSSKAGEYKNYVYDPLLRDYFLALSPRTQEAVVNSGLRFSTLGELQKWVDYHEGMKSE